MDILPILIVFGLIIAAVVWFMIIGPDRKKRKRWNQVALPTASELGAHPDETKYGFQSFRLDIPQGPVKGFATAGLVVESGLINSRDYHSDGSTFYSNFFFATTEGKGPRFEVGSWVMPRRTVDGTGGGDEDFAKNFNVAAESAEEFNALWDEQARTLMKRSGAKYLVAAGGHQIQAVRNGTPESAQEVQDMLTLVKHLAARSASGQQTG